MPKTIEISGALEIEGALFYFEREALPAEARKGTKAAAQLVLAEYQANVQEVSKSGSMRDAAKVVAMKRSRRKIGHKVKIDRNKLFKLYEARTGKPPGSRKGDSEPFFYPVMVELGGIHLEPKAPLRRGLYDNKNQILVEFSNAVLRAINNPKVKKKKK